MPDCKEMYLAMVRAAERAIQALIAAQKACEELYMDQPEQAPTPLPFPKKQEP